MSIDMKQGYDGVPHITYYDKPHALSFIWDVDSPYATVSFGGYSERPFAVIPVCHESELDKPILMRNSAITLKDAAASFIDQIEEAVALLGVAK